MAKHGRISYHNCGPSIMDITINNKKAEGINKYVCITNDHYTESVYFVT